MKREVHVKEFIKNFVAPPRRYRYLRLLEGNARQRAKVSNLLGEPHIIRSRCEDMAKTVKGAANNEKIATIHDRLIALGAPDTCVVWSDQFAADELIEMQLRDGLEVAVTPPFVNTVVSCIPGRLAYYQGDWADDCCICRRT